MVEGKIRVDVKEIIKGQCRGPHGRTKCFFWINHYEQFAKNPLAMCSNPIARAVIVCLFNAYAGHEADFQESEFTAWAKEQCVPWHALTTMFLDDFFLPRIWDEITAKNLLCLKDQKSA